MNFLRLFPYHEKTPQEKAQQLASDIRHLRHRIGRAKACEIQAWDRDALETAMLFADEKTEEGLACGNIMFELSAK
jgi:hypothetical protein